MIRNTAINQDGKTNGITLSSQQAQESLLRYVYQCTGLNPQVLYAMSRHMGLAQLLEISLRCGE